MQAAVIGSSRRLVHCFMGVLLAFSVEERSSRADSLEHPPGWRLEPDAGLVWESPELRLTTWGFGQGVLPWDRGRPYARRVRQGAELLLPHLGPLRPAAVYEVDFADNDFFRAGPAWKIFENAFVSLQADHPDVRLVYGENTHVLSHEDNLSSANLPTINRSLILESHGSIHAFGSQWGGQVGTDWLHPVFIRASLGDNRGSLNQDEPAWSPANDVAGKAVASVGPGALGRMTVGFGADYSRRSAAGTFSIGSAIHASPLLSVPTSGEKLTGEADLVWTRAAAWPFSVELEWMGSRFGNGTSAQGGYVQGMTQLLAPGLLGDVSAFVRPELVLLSRPAWGRASVRAVRAGLDWNLPWLEQRLNGQLEGAWHTVVGPAVFSPRAAPVWEVALLLRVSLTRHVRFAE